ncbi:MAG: DNA-binding protein [Firmicutes bacterium]|nr:DNA-binding protein [Bacillota bacterium]
MLINDPVYLGIDTSNYTTSAAAADKYGNVIASVRKLLDVKQGEKGLRQSDALFQHWKTLPELLEPLLKEYRGRIAFVCAACRPRPAEGSYMPVFTAGTNIGRTAAAALGAEYMETSHQEAHFYAASYGTGIDLSRPAIMAHLSGGTLEFVLKKDTDYSIVFKTDDISYGQLLDRLGTDLGYPFPAGKYIDEAALRMAPNAPKCPFKRVFMTESGLNLSGLETSLRTAENTFGADELSYFAMLRISESFVKAAEVLKEKYCVSQLLVSGGVACSEFLREYCRPYGYIFGQKQFCADNAAGEALIAWRSRCR